MKLSLLRTGTRDALAVWAEDVSLTESCPNGDPSVFRHENVARTHNENLALASFLASTSGFVNSAGFVVVGVFTSHATGNVGRIANDVAAEEGYAAIAAWLLVLAFFLGSFVASMAIESNILHNLPYTYALLLLVEASLLCFFAFGALVSEGARWRDASAAILCVAMGLQNSLVTRVSGAVVRTTHLTGIVTDIGIESARWFRYWRSLIGRHVRVPLVVGEHPTRAPAREKLELLVLIGATFTLGGIVGAGAAIRFGRAALAFPSFGLVLGSAYAMANGRVTAMDRH